MDALKSWLSSHGVAEPAVAVTAAIVAGLAVLALSLAAHFITKGIVLRVVGILVRRTQFQWDDVLLNRKVFSRLSHLAPALVIRMAAPHALADFPSAVSAVETLSLVYMLAVGLAVADGFLNGILDIYNTTRLARRIDIKSFVQVVKLVLFILGGIYILSHLIGRSPLVFFSGIGAFTAVLLLVFKDVILGLVAGIQIMSNNMVRRGDWIEMPKFGVDGDVIDVSLTTVKVQNWDKTISTIPSYALISDSFRNWRGMDESGGRRIKRSLSLDMSSIRFCDEAMLERFKKFQFIREYIDRKQAEVAEHNRQFEVDEAFLINGRHLTNIGTFRAYLEAYLRNHPQIHQGMTLLVRHLAPSPQGLPIEIYLFSKDQAWANYEAIQADIFDHILAVVPLFELRVFQEPAGADLKNLSLPS